MIFKCGGCGKNHTERKREEKDGTLRNWQLKIIDYRVHSAGALVLETFQIYVVDNELRPSDSIYATANICVQRALWAGQEVSGSLSLHLPCKPITTRKRRKWLFVYTAFLNLSEKSKYVWQMHIYTRSSLRLIFYELRQSIFDRPKEIRLINPIRLAMQIIACERNFQLYVYMYTCILIHASISNYIIGILEPDYPALEYRITPLNFTIPVKPPTF